MSSDRGEGYASLAPTLTEYRQAVACQMTEKEWQAQVIALARSLGYVAYHTYSSQRCEPGYPDLSLLRFAPARFVMLELKTERGRLTHAQRRWIEGLLMAGIEAYVVRPSQWEALVEILKR